MDLNKKVFDAIIAKIDVEKYGLATIPEFSYDTWDVYEYMYKIGIKREVEVINPVLRTYGIYNVIVSIEVTEKYYSVKLSVESEEFKFYDGWNGSIESLNLEYIWVF